MFEINSIMFVNKLTCWISGTGIDISNLLLVCVCDFVLDTCAKHGNM